MAAITTLIETIHLLGYSDRILSSAH